MKKSYVTFLWTSIFVSLCKSGTWGIFRLWGWRKRLYANGKCSGVHFSFDEFLFAVFLFYGFWPWVWFFNQSIKFCFITSLRPPIRKVGKSGLLKRLYAPALEICNASASCFASITSGMASNGSLLIKSPFSHEKAAATISVTAAASASVYLSKNFWYSAVT